MDLHSTQFLGKTQIMKSKTDGKSCEAPKTKVKEPHVNREKRVFGTVRSQNALTKIVAEKATKKPLYGISQKPTKPSIIATAVEKSDSPKKPSEKNVARTTKKKSVNFYERVEENKEKILQESDVSGAQTPLRSPFLVRHGVLGTAVERAETPKEPSEKNVARMTKKKSVNFREKVEENKEKMLQESDVPGAQTPLRSPFLVRPTVLSTPYHSAERCSKCRFDKLETSSYWLGQIRLAESVGKHFVSAAFFRLASECKAEPFRNIKVELKKYLARHESLSGEKEWKDLSVSYGLLKEESSLCHENEEEATSEDTVKIHDQEDQKQIMEPVTEQVIIDDESLERN